MSEPCHNGHPFEPGVDIDMEAEGRSPDPRWCNVCGESRSPVRSVCVSAGRLSERTQR